MPRGLTSDVKDDDGLEFAIRRLAVHQIRARIGTTDRESTREIRDFGSRRGRGRSRARAKRNNWYLDTYQS